MKICSDLFGDFKALFGNIVWGFPVGWMFNRKHLFQLPSIITNSLSVELTKIGNLAGKHPVQSMQLYLAAIWNSSALAGCARAYVYIFVQMFGVSRLMFARLINSSNAPLRRQQFRHPSQLTSIRLTLRISHVYTLASWLWFEALGCWLPHHWRREQPKICTASW